MQTTDNKGVSLRRIEYGKFWYRNKIVLVLMISAITLISSCKKEEEEIISLFNPPEWIQGKWYKINNTFKVDLRFSESDIVEIYDGEEGSWSKYFSNEYGVSNLVVDEVIASDTYKIYIEYGGGFLLNEGFTKKANSDTLYWGNNAYLKR